MDARGWIELRTRELSRGWSEEIIQACTDYWYGILGDNPYDTLPVIETKLIWGSADEIASGRVPQVMHTMLFKPWIERTE